MSLVVDTSVIIAVVTNEKSKNKIIKITKGEELIAPVSLQLELGNAFSAMFKRNKITIGLAKEALKYFSMIPIRLLDVDLPSTLEIANEFKIYAYDAYFLECARRFNSPLITLDLSLQKIARSMNLNVKEI